MRILLLGDIVGRAGRKAVTAFLGREQVYDLVVANGENAAGGFGLTSSTADELFGAGVHVITTGNHIWKQKEVFSRLDEEGTRILRPANAPPGNPGTGVAEFEIDGARVMVVNLQGRTFMDGFWDCPFRTVDRILSSHRAQVIVVDFHCEATSEKQVMGRFLDGRVTAVAGTHTHVLTADARILQSGTGYITDLGMCGSHSGIIGMAYDQARLRFLTGRPEKLAVAEGDEHVNGLELQLDETLSIESLRMVDERIRF
jgi:metallophosphoesterase (TIGR00282 family)